MSPLPLPLKLPLRIVAKEESIQVIDAAGMVASYVYVCDEPQRRHQMRRWSRAEGIAIAQVIARALTAEVGGGAET